MLDIPYGFRILLLLSFAIVMVLYDRFKGSVVRQWEYGCVFVVGIIGAIYGAANDAVTVSLSPEYFAIGKGLGFGTGLKFDAIRLGAEAGFSGAVIGCVIWLFALRKTAVPQRCRLIVFNAWIPPVSAVLFSTIAWTLLSHRFDPFDILGLSVGVLSENQARGFLTVWWIHMGAYLGLALGLAVGIVRTRKQ